MGLYQVLVNIYSTFLAIFPAPIQWLVTLALVIAIATIAFGLLRKNVLFLVQQLGATAPRP